MCEKPMVLDIGIGKGGSYVERTPEMIRIGLDKRDRNLRTCMDLYPVYGVAANASPEKGVLPFADKTFTHVDILFPHQSLFYSMCYSLAFWEEIKRVLIDSGSIRAVFDTRNDKRFIQKTPIEHPDKLLLDALDCSGFNARCDLMDGDTVNKIDTMFSKKVFMEMNKSTKVFCLTGLKI